MAIDPDRLSEIWKAARDPLTWTLGAVMAIFEAFFRHGEDQALIVMIVGFITVPGVVKYEKRRNQNGKGDDH